MIDKSDLRAIWEYVVLIAPAPIGALIGLRYATEQTPRGRATNFLCSCGLGHFGGALVGELWLPSPSAVSLATIVITSVSMELMAGLVYAARAFAGDPFGFANKLLDIVGRVFRRGQP